MKWRWILALIALTFVWGRIVKKPPPVPQAVVRMICIRQADDRTDCSDPQTMRQILNALRQPGQLLLLKTEPEAQPERHLTLLLTDGTSRHYTFRGDRYLKKENGPWQEADPDHLSPLLDLLSSLAPGEAQEGPTEHQRGVSSTTRPAVC